MTNLLFLLLGIVAGYYLRKLTVSAEGGNSSGGKSGPEIEEKTEIRLENLRKIMEMLGNEAELTNDEIQKALNVSDRTVVRYMDHLEKEGVIEQVGNTGRSVTYRLKK